MADDLTGACDAGVAFAAAGREVSVAIEAASGSGGAVRALNTESRDLDPEIAVERVCDAAGHAAGAEVFKKVDSVFRGNSFAEIRASLELFAFDLAVIAPAYPDLGRRVLNGRLLVDGAPPLDLLAKLEAVGCRPVAAGQSATAVAEAMLQAMRECRTGQRPAVLCDAMEESHLRTAVEAARSIDRRILWIGSGGLAHALAGERQAGAAEPAVRRGTIVFFIGSAHPVTRAQVEHLHRETNHALLYDRSGAPDPATTGSSPDLLLRVPWGAMPEAEVREAVQHLESRDTACLFMTGGDTALHVCRALGIEALRLEREFAPGVPFARAQGGRFEGVPVLLKSGGFGERDLLHRVMECFAAMPAAGKAGV